MSLNLARVLAGVMLCTFLVSAVLPAAAREPWPAVRLGADGSSKIFAALDASTNFEFIETPLRDVVDYLKELHSIEIQIDQRALEDVGVGTETPVTRNVKGVPLYAALDLVCKALELEYVVTDHLLMITTAEAAERRPEVRLYNVRALAGDQLAPEEIAVAARQALGFAPAKPAQGSAQPGDGAAAPVASFSPVEQPADQIFVLRDVLIVRGSLATHRNVANLLAALAESLAEGKEPAPATPVKPE